MCKAFGKGSESVDCGGVGFVRLAGSGLVKFGCGSVLLQQREADSPLRAAFCTEAAAGAICLEAHSLIAVGVHQLRASLRARVAIGAMGHAGAA